MDLRIVEATSKQLQTALDCGEGAMDAAKELRAACLAYDGSVQSSGRIRQAARRVSASASAFSRWANLAYEAAHNIR